MNVNYICSKCGGESQIWSVACHHCGMPLCTQHAKSIIDDAFDGNATEEVRAFHCESCLKKHHPKAPW